eukprot:706_1
MAMFVDKDSDPPNDNMDNEETAAGNDMVSHLLTSTNQEIALSKMHSTHTPHQHVEPQSNATHLYVPRKWFILLIILVILSIGLSVASLVYSFSHDHKCMCPHAPLPSSAAPPTLANTTTGTVTNTSNNITSQTSPVTVPETTSAYAYSQNSVGDYKMSAINKSHDNWLLCDGSFLDPREYEELFGVIGYSFGSKKSTSEYVHSGSNYGLLVRFALPSAGDRISLREEHIPAHSHKVYMMSYGGYTTGSGAPLTSRYTYHSVNTSKVGKGMSFKLHQPTIFVGHLFMFAGV